MSVSSQKRPLSPHIQIYRWHINMVTSILHRLSGVALAIGTLMVTCWLLALASGAAAFTDMQVFLASPVGTLLLFGWSVALFFHLCSGVKHLLMDTGLFFTLPAVRWASITVLAAAAVMVFWVWCVA